MFDDFANNVLIDGIQQVFWVDAVYTSLSGGDVDCKVGLSHDVILQPSSYDAQVIETGSTVQALYADVGEPVKGDSFEVGSINYTIARITDNDKTFVTMQVVEED